MSFLVKGTKVTHCDNLNNDAVLRITAIKGSNTMYTTESGHRFELFVRTRGGVPVWYYTGNKGYGYIRQYQEGDEEKLEAYRKSLEEKARLHREAMEARQRALEEIRQERHDAALLGNYLNMQHVLPVPQIGSQAYLVKVTSESGRTQQVLLTGKKVQDSDWDSEGHKVWTFSTYQWSYAVITGEVVDGCSTLDNYPTFEQAYQRLIFKLW